MILLTPTDALIVVDPQYDFCPEGALAVAEGDLIMSAINVLSDEFRKANGMTVITQDWHPKGHKSFASSHGVDPFSIVQLSYGDQVAWPDHCVQGSYGAEFHALIRPAVRNASVIIRKGMNIDLDSYSAFYENDQTTATGLTGYLKARGIRRVFLVGLARDYCVGFSALDAVKDGFEAYLVEDATKFIADDSNNAMSERLIQAGVKFVTTADFV